MTKDESLRSLRHIFMNYGGLKNNFASLIFLVMILSLVLTEAGEDPNDKGPDLISHLNLIRGFKVRKS